MRDTGPSTPAKMPTAVWSPCHEDTTSPFIKKCFERARKLRDLGRKGLDPKWLLDSPQDIEGLDTPAKGYHRYQGDDGLYGKNQDLFLPHPCPKELLPNVTSAIRMPNEHKFVDLKAQHYNSLKHVGGLDTPKESPLYQDDGFCGKVRDLSATTDYFKELRELKNSMRLLIRTPKERKFDDLKAQYYNSLEHDGELDTPKVSPLYQHDGPFGKVQDKFNGLEHNMNMTPFVRMPKEHKFNYNKAWLYNSLEHDGGPDTPKVSSLYQDEKYPFGKVRSSNVRSPEECLNDSLRRLKELQHNMNMTPFVRTPKEHKFNYNRAWHYNSLEHDGGPDTPKVSSLYQDVKCPFGTVRSPNVRSPEQCLNDSLRRLREQHNMNMTPFVRTPHGHKFGDLKARHSSSQNHNGGILTPANVSSENERDSGFFGSTDNLYRASLDSSYQRVHVYSEKLQKSSPRDVTPSRKVQLKGDDFVDFKRQPCSPFQHTDDERFVLERLCRRNLHVVVAQVWSHLSDADLLSAGCVSRTWRKMVMQSKDARDRRSAYLKLKRDQAIGPNKENHPKPVAQSRGDLTLFLDVTKSVLNEQPLADKTCKTRYDSFLEVRKSINENGVVLKCPKCNSSSQMELNSKYCCSRVLCSYEFCGKCRGPYLENHACPIEREVGDLELELDILSENKKNRRYFRRL